MKISKEQLKKVLCEEKKISDFAVYTLCALVVILLTPIVARNIPNVIIILLMVLFGVSVIPRIRSLPKGHIYTLVILAAYLMIIAAYKVIGKSSAELYYYFNTVQFLFFLGAIIMISSDLSKKQTNLLLLVSLCALLFTCLYNVVLFFVHGATEYITLFQENKYATNAINTPYASAVMIVSGAALIYGLHKPDLRIKLIAWTLSLLGFLFVSFVTQRMIVVLLSLLMYALIFCGYIKENPLKKLSVKNRVIVIAVIIAVIVLLCFTLIPILRLIRGVVSSDRLVKRINQIIRLLKTGDIDEAGGSLTVRLKMMGASLQTFTGSFGNFLIGAGDHRATNEIIGNHSSLFDELARYGILFAPVCFYLMYRGFCAVRKAGRVRRRTVLARQVNAILIVVVFRFVLGSIFDASIGIALFLMLPLMEKALAFDRRKKAIQQNDNVGY